MRLGWYTSPMDTQEQGKAPKKRKKSKFIRVLLIVLIAFIILPLIMEMVFYLMRVSPGAVIPDTFFVYTKISHPQAVSSKLLEHESLPEILTIPEIAWLSPTISSIRSSGILEKAIVKLALRGTVSAAFLDVKNGGQSYIAAWDSAFLAPFLPLLPLAARLYKIPDLNYVQGGVSRFEIRGEGSTIYIGVKRNLVIVSDNEEVFFHAFSPDGSSYAAEKKASLKNQDLAVLLSSPSVTKMLADGNPELAQVLSQLKFPAHIELGISVAPKQLNISMVTPVTTENTAFGSLLANNSMPPSLMNVLPESAQYYTGLSSIKLREIMNTMAEFPEMGLEENLQMADRIAKPLLGLGIDDILYSWTADEFAVFGLEDKPTPVIAIKIGDEAKRKAVFDKAFHSIFLKEDSRLVLDGNRIPQIELPGFVDAILRIIHVTVPRPYYTIHENWLYLSESPENILATVTELRQNKLLAKNQTWQKLSEGGGANSSLSLYYSLNRSLPFFLKGGSAAASILRMYRQGLMKLSIKDNVLTISLAAEPGSGKGLESMPGYPINIGRKTGSAVYAVLNDSGSESRLLLSRDNSALSINPSDNKVYELKGEDPVWVIPAEGFTIKTMKDSAAWVVSARGLVTLVNGNMEEAEAFPVITGLKLTSAPAAWGGKVYLMSEETGGKGAIHQVDSAGRISKLDAEFNSPILSPPAFINTGVRNETYMALYPKSFLGEIFLCSPEGHSLPPWPITIPGIAFGTPLPFMPLKPEGQPKTHIAFITMAGELSVFDEGGVPLPGFPLELSGVFYVQPAWDGTYLWVVSEEGALFRIDPENTGIQQVMEQKLPNLAVKENGCIMAVDVDFDGIPEIFISGEGNAIYGYTRNMVSIDGFPLSAWGRPAFADLNGDGIMNIAAAGMDNKLYRWRFRRP